MITSSRLSISLFVSTLLLTSCASQEFVSTWKDPAAAPLQLKGAKVAAVVMVKDESMRRPAEDALAREITARGAQGVPMYTLMPGGDPADESAARAACEAAGVQGIVVFKPTAVDKQVETKPVTSLEPTYGSYWGGYYSAGWGTSYAPVTVGEEIDIKRVVTVETRVYSLRQNKLVWSGQSKTTNPEDVDTEVRKLASATAAQLQKEGLLRN
ncbi:MAG TPA: hypothetical protein VFS52_07200 [Steroidobacteraceae bacterium]|jgi:hypothetical protein|nr:hypothetical protein [Steroidobacteraceae bacterium]